VRYTPSPFFLSNLNSTSSAIVNHKITQTHLYTQFPLSLKEIAQAVSKLAFEVIPIQSRQFRSGCWYNLPYHHDRNIPRYYIYCSKFRSLAKSLVFFLFLLYFFLTSCRRYYSLPPLYLSLSLSLSLCHLSFLPSLYSSCISLNELKINLDINNCAFTMFINIPTPLIFSVTSVVLPFF